MGAAAPTMTTTSKTDQRMSDADRTPVWEMVLNGLWDADDTADGTITWPINGILLKVILTVPDTANNVTGQVQINDNGDNTIFDSGEKAEALTHTFNVFEPLSGNIDVVIGISAASGTTVTNVTVTLRGI